MSRLLLLPHCLAVALAVAAGCRGGAPSLDTWKGARFSARYPAGWKVAQESEERVVFDGTVARGAFSVGRELEVRLLPPPVPAPSERFDVSCGSHLCEARLEVGTGAFRVVLMESCETDACPREPELESGLRELAKAVAPTLAPTPSAP